MELEGKVAIVTGASRGVGAATAVALGAEGMHVVCAARATDDRPLPIPGTIDGTVRRITETGGSALAVPTNLALDDDIARMVRTTVDVFGSVDVLVNNAAITFAGDIDIPVKRYDLIFAVNTRAPFLAARAVLPHMRARGAGAILNVSSAAALNYVPELMVYGMSKIALEHMTVSLASQLQPFNIAVNTFRIDVPVASEGFMWNFPDLDTSDWEPTELAAEGIVWMLRQPPDFTGHNLGITELRAAYGIMPSRSGHEHPDRGTFLRTNPMRMPHR